MVRWVYGRRLVSEATVSERAKRPLISVQRPLYTHLSRQISINASRWSRPDQDFSPVYSNNLDNWCKSKNTITITLCTIVYTACLKRIFIHLYNDIILTKTKMHWPVPCNQCVNYHKRTQGDFCTSYIGRTVNKINIYGSIDIHYINTHVK